MAYTLKDKIFSFFGVNAKVKDTYKGSVLMTDGGIVLTLDDGSELLADTDKGINQRYNEVLGEDYDESVGPLVDNFHDNLFVPKTCQSKFIEFLEYNVGKPVIVVSTDSFRRKMLELNNSITMIKGTLLSHQVLFGMLGVTVVTITVLENTSGFDSDVTLDDAGREFDGSATCCRHYTIALTGGAVQDATLNASILRIARYLQPIDSEIDSITYNSNAVPLA